MNDFSIDLETLGTRYNAPIVSIGVAQFNRFSGQIGETFYRAIDLNSALRAGVPSGATIAWWIGQGAAAKKVFSEKDCVSLATALDELSQWMRKLTPSPIVWGNGSTFDISILEHAYDHGGVGLREPWNFRDIRDMRTIMEAADFTEVQYHAMKTNFATGVHHNALDDAIYQAKMIAAACERIHRAVNTKGGQYVDPKPVSMVQPKATVAAEDDEL